MAGIIEGLSAISSALGSLKTATEIVRRLRGTTSDADRGAETLKLYREIETAQLSALTANAAQMALIERVRDLEEECAKAETWSREKLRYELKRVAHVGTVAYVIKPNAIGTEAPHCICAACYERHTKGVLQPTHESQYRMRLWECAVCKITAIVETPLPGFETQRA